MTTEEIKVLTEKYNNLKYFQLDPLSVVKRCVDKRDIEILGLLCSWLAYGNRVKIYQACCWVYDVMEGKPYDFIINEKYEKFNDNEECLYRLYKLKDFHYLCKRLYLLYTSFDSMEDALIEYDKRFDYDYLHFLIYKVFAGIKGVPKNTLSCCKRMNLFLRWMGRKDGINDCGIWKTLDESKLLLPLDVHSLNTLRELGVITRKSNDMKTVLQATEFARTIFPDDPAKLDFFLFGYSYEKAHPKEFEEPKKKEITEVELLTLATSQILYVNDLAINAIQEINYMVRVRNKEDRRIYSALSRRTANYNKELNDIVGGNINFFSEFNLAMDELIEDKYKAYKDSIHSIYEKRGIEDAEYLAYIEVARSMTEYAVLVNKKTVESLLKITQKAIRLRHYRLSELQTICENFADWCYRKIKGFDLNKEGNCLECFRELDKTLSSLENIDKCIKKANIYIKE